MNAMQRDQPLGRQEAKPKEWRHRRVGGVLGKAPRGIHERLLAYVRRVDAPLQSPVQAKLHHAAEPVAMISEQFAQRVLLARANASQQSLIGVGIAGHVGHPEMITAHGYCSSTGRQRKILLSGPAE